MEPKRCYLVPGYQVTVKRPLPSAIASIVALEALMISEIIQFGQIINFKYTFVLVLKKKLRIISPVMGLLNYASFTDESMEGRL